ncbi:MAG: YciI family protein [Pseudorhodoplanes sp.]|uniref:YciI family protein n=1 Tax=Pseudorhodoplanes sp. TaxID=1934341 RepID=UPI003D0D5FCB
MAVWACLFHDTEKMLAARRERRADHHAFLDRHREMILLAGALLGEDESQPSAALWIVEADSREAVETLIGQDPYFQSGHRSCRILEWKLARERYGEHLRELLAFATDTT